MVVKLLAECGMLSRVSRNGSPDPRIRVERAGSGTLVPASTILSELVSPSEFHLWSKGGNSGHECEAFARARSADDRRKPGVVRLRQCEVNGSRQSGMYRVQPPQGIFKRVTAEANDLNLFQVRYV